jgi:hypothetical protein
VEMLERIWIWKVIGVNWESTARTENNEPCLARSMQRAPKSSLQMSEFHLLQTVEKSTQHRHRKEGQRSLHNL